MTVDEILSRFDGVRRSGDGWIARRPGHEDRKPSLSRDSASRVCAGCGVTFASDDPQLYDDSACTNRHDQRLHNARVRGLSEVAVCPSCGDLCARLGDVTGWCRSCAREHQPEERDRADLLARRAA